MKITPRKIFITGIVVFIILIFILLLSRMKKSESSGLVTELDYSVRGFPVEIQRVSQGDIEKSVVISGSIQAQRDVTLTSRAGGEVSAVLVEIGRRVQSGDTLIILDSEIAELNYRQAQAAYESTAADYQTALKDLERVKKLYQSGSLSEREIDSAEMTEIRLKAACRTAEAARDIALRNYKDTAVGAPFSGFIAEVLVETGEISAPGQPLIRLVDIDSVEISAGMTAEEIDELSNKSKVTVRPAKPGAEIYQGFISALGPAASQDGTFPIEIIIPNTSLRLKAGTIAEVKIVKEKFQNIIIIPRAAVLKKKEGDAVFVIEGNTALLRYVNLGVFDENTVEVKEGLNLNETIIVKGHTVLQDSAAVMVLNPIEDM